MGRKFTDREFDVQYMLIERCRESKSYLCKLEGYFGVNGIGAVADKINSTNNDGMIKLMKTIGER